MKGNTITTRSAGSIMVIMILSSATLVGLSTVKQDFWISILLSGILFLPAVLIYSRICALYPQQGLYDILQTLYGKVVGSILTFIFSFHALAVGALALRNFVEFTAVIALENTPKIPLMISILFVSLFLARQGLFVFGKWSIVVCVIILLNLLFTSFLGMDVMNLSHIKPILDHSFLDIASNADSIGAVSIGETVLIMVFMGHMGSGKSSYKIYLRGLLVGIVALALIELRNLLILGPEMNEASKFSGYMAMRLVHLGTFFERLESTISFNLILLGITKTSLGLSAAAMGAAKLLKSDDYHRLLLPISLLVLALSSITFKTAYDEYNFARVYQYVAFPIQVAIPLVVWIKAEIKARKRQACQIEKEGL